MDPAELLPVFTVGHSTRTIEAFVGLLRAGEVGMVVDIRSVPRSRTNPQYNLDTFPGELARWQIGHEYVRELGGLRGRSRTVPAEVNGFWENASFHNYADYALGEDFERGLDRLQALSRERRCAVMCAEAVWWRCHRRIVADYLLLRGREVMHLMDTDRVEPARMTSAARPDGKKLVYPAAQGALALD